MKDKRYLIVNADDFGQSPGVNRGVAETFENGIVKAASMMVRWPAAAAAAAYARKHPKLCVGLHIDLGEWTLHDHEWEPRYQVVPLNDAQAIQAEALWQLNRFRSLVGREPTHLDSHQHVHRREPVRSILVKMASQLCIPLRHYHSEIAYCGQFYGQAADGSPLLSNISIEGFSTIIHNLANRITELCCHPARMPDLESMYVSERAIEADTLCDEQTINALTALNFELCSFSTLAGHESHA